MALLEWLVYPLIPTLILVHLFVAPYTKVEESFNIQAIHDILIHGIPTENADRFFTANYDHVSFPGSVPRTFAGALLLSGLSRPFVQFCTSPDQIQLLVRAVLGLANGIVLIAFARSVKKTFGLSAGIWFALLQASQFHVIYYASRTLPNMFAFIFSTVALKSLLNGYATSWSSTSVPRSYRLCLYLLTISGVVFRSELAILVATITLYLFATQRISITSIIIPAGLGGLVIGLLSTVPLDSFFWQSFPLWPEWTGFYYNTILGHSSEWGVSPWYFYFANALPRLLVNPLTYLVCIPVALLNVATRKRSLDILLPILGFVGLYSFLPHKEWRFIIYVIPGLTAIAAAGASWIWTRRAKSAIYSLVSLALVGSVLLSFMASTALLVVSSLNYPGGTAVDFLHHKLIHPSRGEHFNVFFDNLACQTGVTRFLEIHEPQQTIVTTFGIPQGQGQRTWRYWKTEDPELLLDPLFWLQFEYVLAEKPERIIGKWDIVHTVYGFNGIRFLKPGQSSNDNPDTQEITAGTKDDLYVDPAAKRSTSSVQKAWKTLEGLLRDRVLRGYWVEIKMEPKIRILRKDTGTMLDGRV
ncbi:glycosyltransferase family 22 protein [Amniculicola lignicola CBS 123094]|uniref:Mannosyltransferase n=1 Tax=Amniculicola lignicola CBS 123094 TaxID=1392246 RepID=A0A6A5W2B8_9PLEO|nr:glycosyltransferase family 22 protein [Amniculicola lignicola CBS 123094]